MAVSKDTINKMYGFGPGQHWNHVFPTAEKMLQHFLRLLELKLIRRRKDDEDALCETQIRRPERDFLSCASRLKSWD